jgi:4-hydroxybenzoate polyprenyltransferase
MTRPMSKSPSARDGQPPQVTQDRMVADALAGSWVHRFLPQAFWPYAQLARWERPIGWRLLMWPCWWSLMLANHTGIRIVSGPGHWLEIGAQLLLFTAGAFLARGAGCTYNDLVDVDIDAKVARTRSRPLPSGRVTRGRAIAFLLLQALVGLIVLVQFNRLTVLIGLLSLVTVAVYPFMKRITWWPQLFLGFAFSWGALVGWPAATGRFELPALVLYLGCICWVIGYDTIYALQDIEDDALVGVKSTARLFGDRVRSAVAILYAMALILFAVAFWMTPVNWPAWAGLGLGALHMIWQVRTLDPNDPARCLWLFKSNSHFGSILFGGLMLSLLV